MTKIDTLKAEIFWLEAQLRSVRRELRYLRRLEAEAKYGVSEGVVVTDSDGTEYRVVSVDAGEIRIRPWLVGNPRKKDGTWSKRSRNLYGDWVVAPALTPAHDVGAGVTGAVLDGCHAPSIARNG